MQIHPIDYLSKLSMHHHCLNHLSWLCIKAIDMWVLKVNYLITPSFENMTPRGIVSHTKAYNENLREAPSTSMQPMRREVRSEGYAPSTPPPLMEWENDVSSQIEPTTISFVPVQRIMINQVYEILYQNSASLFHSTPMSPTLVYPFENMVKVHHEIRGTLFH